MNAIKLYINNGRVMQIHQNCMDEKIIVSTMPEESAGINDTLIRIPSDIDARIEISPGDMVMLINHYRNCIDQDRPICE